MHTRSEARLSKQFQSLSRGKKMVLIVFLIWAAQAIPKWTLAITADGETSAKIVGIFITPKYQQLAYTEPVSEKTESTPG